MQGRKQNNIQLRTRHWCWLLLVLLWTSVTLPAAELAVSEARMRLLPGDLPAAGYFTVRNTSENDTILVGAESPAFGNVEMHRSVNQGGVSSMQPVSKIALAARGQAVFAPHGYHLMLMQRKRSLAIGEEVDVILLFEDEQRLKVKFQALSPTIL